MILEQMKKEKGNAEIIVICFFTILCFFVGMFGLPLWNVWKEVLYGEAALNKAKQTKKIMIQTALAEKESAVHRAQAIEIMGEAAKKYPEYRQQEFIQAFGEALREGTVSQIICVPTEANIPIMEASKRQ